MIPSLYSVSEPVKHSKKDGVLKQGTGCVGGWVRGGVRVTEISNCHQMLLDIF